MAISCCLTVNEFHITKNLHRTIKVFNYGRILNNYIENRSWNKVRHPLSTPLPPAEIPPETTIASAYALNDPLIVAEGARDIGVSASTTSSFLSVDRPNVFIETVKQAEDGQGVIVRLYESQRHRGRVTLTSNFALASVWRTNLLEENQSQLSSAGNKVNFLIKPCQIVTLRLIPR